jgi:hypothetical protein
MKRETWDALNRVHSLFSRAEFVGFLQNKLAEWEADVAPGDTAAAAEVECLRLILGHSMAPKPRPRGGRPTLVYSRKAPNERNTK